MKSKPNQKKLWLLAALAAPVAHFSGCGWLTAGLTALVVLPLSLLPKKWESLPKTVALLEIAWLGIVTGNLLRGSAAYWPSDNDLAVPLTILALALWTNAAAAPRICTVLALCMALLAIPLGVSAMANLKPDWLRPGFGPWSARLAVTLLLPSLPVAGEAGKGRGPFGAVLLTTLTAALVQGVIGPETAATLEDPFYQTARTLGYLEPVAAVGMTLGWYALTTWLLQSAGQISQNAGINRMCASVLLVGTAAGCILFEWQLYGPYLPVLSAVFWILIPFAAKIIFFEKR